MVQFECDSMHRGFCGGRARTSGSEGTAVKASVQLLEKGLGPNTVHVATAWQQFVPTFDSLKLIWVCMHVLHSLWSAEIQSSGSFMWCEQIYLPTAIVGKYLFFAHLQFSWKWSLRQTEGCSTSSF